MTTQLFKRLRDFAPRPRHLFAFCAFLTIFVAAFAMLIATNPAYVEAKQFAKIDQRVTRAVGGVRDARLRVFDGFSFNDEHGEFSFSLTGERLNAILNIELTFRDGGWKIDFAELHQVETPDQTVVLVPR